MPESELIVQPILITGTIITYVSANQYGNYFLNDGRTWLKVVKTDAGSTTDVTIHAQILCGQEGEHDQIVTVTYASPKDAGPFDTVKFNLNKYVHVTYSNTVNLVVAAIRI